MMEELKRLVAQAGELMSAPVPERGSDEERSMVIQMAVAGIEHTKIAAYLKMSFEQLRYRYSHELETSTDVLVARVGASMAMRALAGDVRAQESFLKARGGDAWRDKKALEITGKDGGPVELEMKSKLVEKLLAMIGPQKAEAPMIDVTPSTKNDP